MTAGRRLTPPSVEKAADGPCAFAQRAGGLPVHPALSRTLGTSHEQVSRSPASLAGVFPREHPAPFAEGTLHHTRTEARGTYAVGVVSVQSSVFGGVGRILSFEPTVFANDGDRGKAMAILRGDIASVAWHDHGLLIGTLFGAATAAVGTHAALYDLAYPLASGTLHDDSPCPGTQRAGFDDQYAPSPFTPRTCPRTIRRQD